MSMLDEWLEKVADSTNFLEIDRKLILLLIKAFNDIPAAVWAEATCFLDSK